LTIETKFIKISYDKIN